MARPMRGMEMSMDRKTRLMKSFEKRVQRLTVLAPRTFRTPISFVRFSATKEARPKRPRQEIKIAREEKTMEMSPIWFSAANFSANSWSLNSYRKGLEGL